MKKNNSKKIDYENLPLPDWLRTPGLEPDDPEVLESESAEPTLPQPKKEKRKYKNWLVREETDDDSGDEDEYEGVTPLSQIEQHAPIDSKELGEDLVVTTGFPRKRKKLTAKQALKQAHIENQRQAVLAMSASGLSMNKQARILRMKPERLKKLFPDELENGLDEANAMVAHALLQKCRDGDVRAMMYWLSRKGGFVEQSASDPGTNAPDMSPTEKSQRLARLFFSHPRFQALAEAEQKKANPNSNKVQNPESKEQP